MFNAIDSLVESARYPIEDAWLESLQDQFDEHHNYYRFVYLLALSRRPQTILEIGTYFGIGSAYLAAAAKTYGGQVIGLDLEFHEMTNPNGGLINSRYGNYHFIKGDSTDEIVDKKLDGK